MYRVKGLSWAKRWAQSTGRAGARYPWQTAAIGKVASHANEEEVRRHLSMIG
jgi:trehalose/maltose hydrolase-like predicted phosphorylase|eukprot:SAG25_NODE_1532_length_2831_cov_51.460410_2_plen_52_part_00